MIIEENCIICDKKHGSNMQCPKLQPTCHVNVDFWGNKKIDPYSLILEVFSKGVVK